MSELAPSAPDPSARLEAAFRAVEARMRGLTFVNPALRVEAVGFHPWQGCWLGVLITPWFMNLVLAPGDPDAWHPLAVGAKRLYRFPAGTYEFIGGSDEAAGEYQGCSLFSPVLQFADHETARQTAACALDALLDPGTAQAPATPASGAEGVGGIRQRLERPISKRDLLRGRFLRATDEEGGY